MKILWKPATAFSASLSLNRTLRSSSKVENNVSDPLFLTVWMIINPAFGCLLLFYILYRSNRFSKMFSVPIGLLFASIGYNTYPIGEPDLVRYLGMVENMQGLTLSSALHSNTDILYVKKMLFWLVSRTNDAHILPFIIGLLVYTVVFYVYFDFINRTQYYRTWGQNGKLYALMAMLGAVGIQSPFSVIGNVRCVSSYVFISYAVYRELVQKKLDVLTLICYIAPCFLHTSAIVVLGFRFLLIIFRRIGNMNYFLSFLIILFFPVLVPLISQTLMNIPNLLIKNAVSQGLYYMQWTSGGWADRAPSGKMYWIDRIYGTPFILFAVFSYFKLNKYYLMKQLEFSEATDKRFLPFIQYLFLISVATLCCLWIKVGAFWRFEACFCLYSPVLFLALVQKQLETDRRISRGLNILLYSGAFMFLFSCALFARWVHMDLFITGFFTTCPALLLAKLIKALVSVM